MARRSSHSRIPNLLASSVMMLAIVTLYASFDPVPAGETPAAEPAAETTSVEEFAVPLPSDAASLPTVSQADISEPTAAQDGKSTDTEPAAVEPVTVRTEFTSRELTEYCMLLLKDGQEYLNQFDTYTAVFHKQERIRGDLTESHSISIKVRQGDNFAVYMKWKNGDRGRQLLYSTDYEDGNMVVKLGGFKGRLLPAIRLDPMGAQAMSESRHPVTQAGIQGMLKKMISHRVEDLERGHGSHCTRLPNREFDGRNCLCFLFEYDSPEASETYRKNVVLLDSTNHIPVLVRNYTWAAETDGLTAEQMDDMTLIESYSFTNIDFTRKLAAVEFSRDNPRYRM